MAAGRPRTNPEAERIREAGAPRRGRRRRRRAAEIPEGLMPGDDSADKDASQLEMIIGNGIVYDEEASIDGERLFPKAQSPKRARDAGRARRRRSGPRRGGPARGRSGGVRRRL